MNNNNDGGDVNGKRWRKGDFTIVPSNQALHGLSAHAQALYLNLCMFADSQTGECYPSFSTLAEQAGMSRSTVKKYIAELEKEGLISITKRKDRQGRQDSNLYVVKQVSYNGDGVHNKNKAGSTNHRGGVANNGGMGLEKPTNNNQKNNNQSNNKSYKFNDNDFRLAKLLDSKIKNNYPAKEDKETNLERWADDIRKLRDLDDTEPEQIEILIYWVHGGELMLGDSVMTFDEHDFWSQNIQSAKKLRDQFYDQLYPKFKKWAEDYKQENKIVEA